MSPPGEAVVVAGAADTAYALPLAVMLRSAVAHLDPRLRLDAYVVADGLTADARERVAASLLGRGTVRWLPPHRPAATPLPTWGGMPLTTYQKLWIGEWLPAGIERAIWLDCDVLVLADLGRLWRESTGDHSALAAADPLVRKVSSRFGIAAYRELGLCADAPYFNAGVMRIDVERWRREGVAARAATYLARHRRRVTFWDQEALNAALAGRWARLDSRWNVQPTLSRLFAPPLGDPVDHRPQAFGEAWIVHFSGTLKPWRVQGLGAYQERFFAHLDETPWRGFRPPPAWRDHLVTRFATSPLRRALFPLEQRWTSLRRRFSLRQEAP